MTREHTPHDPDHIEHLRSLLVSAMLETGQPCAIGRRLWEGARFAVVPGPRPKRAQVLPIVLIDGSAHGLKAGDWAIAIARKSVLRAATWTAKHAPGKPKGTVLIPLAGTYGGGMLDPLKGAWIRRDFVSRLPELGAPAQRFGLIKEESLNGWPHMPAVSMSVPDGKILRVWANEKGEIDEIATLCPTAAGGYVVCALEGAQRVPGPTTIAVERSRPPVEITPDVRAAQA